MHLRQQNSPLKLKGILYGCISSGTYGLIPLFALPIMNKGIAFDSVLFYRFSCATVALAVLMLFRKVSFRIGQNEILPLITLGILFALSALCLFRSYNFMPAGIAATILFSYPIFVTLIMAVFFHEKISLIIITAITLAFTGIYLLY
ncbi:MAG: EamA family transporter, partial [Barnesiella sp.]